MKRWICTSMSLVALLLLGSFAACGNNNRRFGSGGGSDDLAMKPDLAMRGSKDLSMIPDPDLSMIPDPDLAMDQTPDMSGILNETGSDCTVSADCPASLSGINKKATCQKSSTFAGKAIMWPGGFCTSGCSDAANDKMTGENLACPSSNPATCFNGLCMLLCTDSSVDCKNNYICANVTQAGAICLPLAASTCDPIMDPRPANKKCPINQTCVDYSPDRTYGECATTCDPIAQGCPAPMVGQNGCVLDYDLMNGTGTCIGVSPASEGSACVYLNGCSAGMQCFAQKCRQYCRTGNNPVGCPNGQTCKIIPNAGIPTSTLGICSP